MKQFKAEVRTPPSRIVKLGFVTWLVGTTFVMATLMVGHWYTLPKPDLADGQVAASLNALRQEDSADKWLAVHVLYSECRCSHRVFDHLFSSQRPTDISEYVLLIGADEELESRAQASGFALSVLTPQELKSRFHIESAPLLIVLNPAGSIEYSGGYTPRKQGPEVQDLHIIEALRTDRDIKELPLYGCGVSKDLQDTLDPMGIKY